MYVDSGYALAGVANSHRLSRRSSAPSAVAVLLLALICLLASGCANLSHRAVDARAAGYGLARKVVSGDTFQHVVYQRPGTRQTDAGTLHVYIEGDGVPWRFRTVIASDPTSRNTLMLRLMNLDSAPSAYLGRPCYLGLLDDPACEPDVWTFSRYSQLVVDSMAAAIRDAADPLDRVVLFGHSGGGTLAMLLAEQLPNVAAIVTVAGNLDVSAWTTHHAYTPLYGSLDPARRAPLPPRVRQLHLLGDRDKKIPPALVADLLARQPGATIWRFEQNNHSCCWEAIWPNVLAWVRQQSRRGIIAVDRGRSAPQQPRRVVADNTIHAQLK